MSLITRQHFERGPTGCSANAFTSLSPAPPLVLVCFDTGARTLDVVRETARLGICILAATQADVSRAFATKLPQADRFARVRYRLKHGVPVVDGCLACASLTSSESSRAAITWLCSPVFVAGEVDHGASPLVFFGSRYRHLVPSAAELDERQPGPRPPKPCDDGDLRQAR